MGTRTNHPSARRTASVRRYREPFVRRYRGWILGIAGVAVFGALLGFAILQSRDDGGSMATSQPSTPLDAALSKSLQSIDASVFTAVGDGNSSNPPEAINGTALTEGGKPGVLYVGAEFCPFCAAERWPLILALSRFGSFSNLQSSHSAADDAYPNTPTLSFYGATYDSDYFSFNAVELYTNERVNGAYAPLQQLTEEQQKIVNAFNNGGGIPYVYFGGRYEVSGANFNPSVLQGMTVAQVIAAVQDPSTPQSKAIAGSANMLTAALCELTGGEPASVCNAPEVVEASMQLE